MPRKILQQTTSFNTIKIEEARGQHYLKFDSDHEAIQSAIDLTAPHRLVMTNLQYLMGILLFIKKPRRILVLGVGGGSLIHFLSYYLPKSHITGLDYNAELLKIAQAHLDLPQPSDQIHYVTADAREFIGATHEKFDLILVDLFTNGRSPNWLLQNSFNQQLKQCLTAQGAIAFNLLIDNENQFSRFYQLMRTVYQKQTLCLEHEDYENILVYGFNQEKETLSLEANLERAAQLTSIYELPFTQILAAIYNINPVGHGII
ncbi:MAG: methyltransferase domain-containing protein [Gammaproteobacteria bacterium]|nr:methyltransferase domain-containing protein [Gammaproteobacteria bacterium]